MNSPKTTHLLQEPWFRAMMAKRQPRGPWQHVLWRSMHLPGAAGRSAARKLRRSLIRMVERDFLALVKRLPPNSLCVDLGANVGKITGILLDHGHRVIAFEPDPATFEVLSQNIGARTGVTLVQAAAGTADGTARLMRVKEWDPETLSGSEGSSLVETSGRKAEDAVDVRVVDLAAYLRDIDEDIALLKMDIEGGEWDLIPHLDREGSFDRIDHVLVETHEWCDPSREATAARFREMARTRNHPKFQMDWI